MTNAMKVGELNGKWSWLMKFMLIVFPFAVTYQIYLHNSIKINREDIIVLQQFMAQGKRVTQDHLSETRVLYDAKISTLRSDLLNEVLQLEMRLPKQEWRDKIDRMAADVQQIKVIMAKHYHE